MEPQMETKTKKKTEDKISSDWKNKALEITLATLSVAATAALAGFAHSAGTNFYSSLVSKKDQDDGMLNVVSINKRVSNS